MGMLGFPYRLSNMLCTAIPMDYRKKEWFAGKSHCNDKNLAQLRSHRSVLSFDKLRVVASASDLIPRLSSPAFTAHKACRDKASALGSLFCGSAGS